MSNVLTFPRRVSGRADPSRTEAAKPPFSAGTTALDQATVSAKSDVIENNRRILRIISNKGRRIDPDYPLPDAAVVIAAAMRCVRRRGRRITALPLGVRADLEALCKAHDPAAILVRDWIKSRTPTLKKTEDVASGKMGSAEGEVFPLNEKEV
ncbi:hypothetical protein [Rhizobium sp. C1]|uniref:hypothetical protein n=1 Tax=Rhizobium sp. C1 TaxID=1349799 RepID=UPI001E2D967F|nr:hypothetical protein [Rhizobium sp. C1]MCD2177363.1 hypothetical protein [Rhizobium sp. C1]